MWRFGHRHHPRRGRCRRSAGLQATLADLHPGEGAQLMGFAPGLPQELWVHLQAYGLVPGRYVRVLQHNPVTVVQVEHCEIALEEDLACQICIAPMNVPQV
jgi:Fe2+ transport system protein FeoA